MRRYVHEAVVDTPPIELQGELAPGRRYTLKPRGGPAVTMSVEAMDRPGRSSIWPICRSRRCVGRTSSTPSRQGLESE
jgi:hypothetical protein